MIIKTGQNSLIHVECLCFSALFSKISHTLCAVLELTVRKSSPAHYFPRRPQPFFCSQPYLRANIPPHSQKLSYINVQALSTNQLMKLKTLPPPRKYTHETLPDSDFLNLISMLQRYCL